MFCKDFLYICWTWLPALEHGKIEENTVNSGIFNGWGDKGIGSIVEHDVFDRFSGDKSVKTRRAYSPKTVSHRDQTPKTVSHRDQNSVVFSTFFEDFWVSEPKRVLKRNFGSVW